MRHTDTIIIGGGQAGLAVSRCLTRAGRDHVVLERGRLGESWRTQRWDSLRLLSPNWMTRLPGWSYDGNDPDGFMAARELVGVLERYARSFAGPVEEQTTVEAVEWDGDALHGRDRPGFMAERPPRGRDRALHAPVRSADELHGGRVGSPAHPRSISAPRTAARRRCPGRRSLGHRRAAGRGARPRRSGGRARGR